jgi:membrane-associated phospholipid phosphatase
MLRIILPAVVSAFVLGCQSEARIEGQGPARLNDRLQKIEETRLAACRPGGHGASTAWAVRMDPRGARANPTATGSDPRTARADAEPLGDEAAWTLSDFGDQTLERGAKANTEASTYETDHGEKYLHKAPLPSLGQTVKRDVKEMGHDLWHDTKQVYGNPVNVAILAAAYGGSLAVQETGPDDTVEDHFRPGHHHFSDGWRNTFDAVGNPGTHFALAGAWYLIGEQLQDDKTYNVGKTLASALIINGLTTMAGQAASWDRDPNGQWGTFPSGHTSSSFCFASVMHHAYGHVVGVPLYGLATMVAMERVDDRNHYFSDVLMGAVVGTVIGHSVASGRDPEIFGWKVLPYANPEGGAGVAFYKSLD